MVGLNVQGALISSASVYQSRSNPRDRSWSMGEVFSMVWTWVLEIFQNRWCFKFYSSFVSLMTNLSKTALQI